MWCKIHFIDCSNLQLAWFEAGAMKVSKLKPSYECMVVLDHEWRS